MACSFQLQTLSAMRFSFFPLITRLIDIFIFNFCKICFLLCPMQASVQCCALATATTEVECAIVKKATKVLNAKSQQESVKCPVAPDMDDALRESAIVSAVSKEMTAPNVSFKHQIRFLIHPSTHTLTHIQPKCAIQISIVIFTGDCMDPTCSSHGTCINGQCYCKFANS